MAEHVILLETDEPADGFFVVSHRIEGPAPALAFLRKLPIRRLLTIALYTTNALATALETDPSTEPLRYTANRAWHALDEIRSALNEEGVDG